MIAEVCKRVDQKIYHKAKEWLMEINSIFIGSRTKTQEGTKHFVVDRPS